MIDWTASMQQTFEYYLVDPGTWGNKRKLTNIKSGTVKRDADAETLGSATIDVTESFGECYIRIYLIAVQNGETCRESLGTFLVQTPSTSFDGKTTSVSLDAYTPLLELKDIAVPVGYTIPKNSNIMDYAYSLTLEHARAPVVKPTCYEILQSDFVAELDDTWLSFNTDLIANAKYGYALDELGRILFAPNQDTASLQPVWTYDDSNSSILYPDISLDRDLYGIPNVVEVVYSKDSGYLFSRVENNDANSPISIPNRGREVVYRETSPEISSNPTQGEIDVYAEQLLRDKSTLEYTLSYSHGYCPVRLGDCVRLNYERAGITNVKAKVTSQSIKCEPGCPVTETAVFTTKLWG